MKLNARIPFLHSLGALLALAAAPALHPTRAADHGDAPNVAGDQAADLADIYFFRHPTVATDVVLIATVRGFIVPGEAENFGIFDPNIRFRFALENTGDSRPDKFIDVVFGPRLNTATGQTATLTFYRFGLVGRNAIVTKTASGAGIVATDPTLAASTASPPQNGAPAQVVQDLTVGTNTVKFFAGEVDDPFFFDIPGFARTFGPLSDDNAATTPNLANLNRGRDTFAGYNVMAIALQFPISMLGTPPASGAYANKIGVECATQRRTQILSRTGVIRGTGPWLNADREGNPAVNVALIPFSRKNEYNAASTIDDARLRFLGDADHTDDVRRIDPATRQRDLRGIADVFAADNLNTPAANVALLAEVAVTAGDFLRLNVTLANTGAGGGDNAGAGFPNGRRLKDDVIDTLLEVLTGIPNAGDGADANDITLQDVFPFVAHAQQPRPRLPEPADPAVPDTNLDDNTRN